MADPNHACKNCFNCQMKRQRELDEKIERLWMIVRKPVNVFNEWLHVISCVS